jgi:hypothetical protein
MTRSPAQPRIKHCPARGVSMLRSPAKSSHPDLDHFECLNCGLVMDYFDSNTSHPEPQNEEKTQSPTYTKKRLFEP